MITLLKSQSYKLSGTDKSKSAANKSNQIQANVSFWGEEETGEPGEKPSEQDENEKQTQRKYDTHLGRGKKPERHW